MLNKHIMMKKKIIQLPLPSQIFHDIGSQLAPAASSRLFRRLMSTIRLNATANTVVKEK